MNKKVIILIIIISLPFIVNGRIVLNPEEEIYTPNMKLSALIPHSTITIINDTDFAFQAALEFWPGNGSPSDPYIIANYSIDSGATEDLGIIVRDTSVSFIIENCLIQDSVDADIFLINLTSAIIRNVTISNGVNSASSIIIYESSNILVEGNIITKTGSNTNGIQSHTSNNIKITNNLISGDLNGNAGILIYNFVSESTYNIEVNNNTLENIYFGIYFDANTFSSNNSILNNRVSSGTLGIFLEYVINSRVENNYIDNFLNSGMYLAYCGHLDIINNSISRTSNYGLEVRNTNDFTNSRIINNSFILNANHGVYIETSIGITLIGNVAAHNGQNGFYITVSQSYIGNNTFFNNSINGMSINGGNNEVLSNWFENNNDYGIYINPSGSYSVTNNVFLNNSFWHTSQGSASSGAFYYTVIIEYNYWSDWLIGDSDSNGIVDFPYYLDGGAAGLKYYDNYPYMDISSISIEIPEESALFGLNSVDNTTITQTITETSTITETETSSVIDTGTTVITETSTNIVTETTGVNTTTTYTQTSYDENTITYIVTRIENTTNTVNLTNTLTEEVPTGSTPALTILVTGIALLLIYTNRKKHN